MTCQECGAVADKGAEGWGAHRADEPYEPPLAVFYCPDCAKREFAEDTAGDV
jgi:hypothetical protein